MSVQDFINDPESYSKSHKVKFGNIGPEIAGLRLRNRVKYQGWSSYQYERCPPYYTNFAFDGDTVFDDVVNNIQGWHVQLGRQAWHTVTAIPGWQDKGICYLPWEEDAVTCIQIPSSAKTFFTGPLTGCSVHIGDGSDGSLWAFHANRNGIEERHRNAAVKQAMTAMTSTSLGLGIRGRHAAIKGTHYDNLAFVFGKKSWRGRWTFYVADIPIAGARCTVTALP
ncbi:hypothetical protein EJV46_15555 [Roseococcus sp. SYP-B2431]|uniref:hypothetical protein n=1 Tax=Roseococcus sp. SYP-B2431 TaxID=2496640 RepID=UPI00103E8DD9|nr:hypothetical protein [Roseococcus sp. SYP-B2431]TCH97541.1 hypothetical protein EJV46_15555 [Roseococcus sp. SYP-B2431]